MLLMCDQWFRCKNNNRGRGGQFISSNAFTNSKTTRVLCLPSGVGRSWPSGWFLWYESSLLLQERGRYAHLHPRNISWVWGWMAPEAMVPGTGSVEYVRGVCVTCSFLFVSVLGECWAFVCVSMRVGMHVCICVCLPVFVYMSDRVRLHLSPCLLHVLGAGLWLLLWLQHL